MVKIWLISDTHFGHENILKFEDATGEKVRPGFTSVAHMDQCMIQRWNAVVKPEDHVYHLGDVTMERRAAVGPSLALVKSLNGHKRLILGNHDHYPMKAYSEVGFEKIMSARFLAGLLLTHIPVHPLSLGKALANVHGHIHEKAAYASQYVNVSVEQIDYTPIALDQVLAEVQEARAYGHGI